MLNFRKEKPWTKQNKKEIDLAPSFMGWDLGIPIWDDDDGNDGDGGNYGGDDDDDDSGDEMASNLMGWDGMGCPSVLIMMMMRQVT